MLRNRGLHSPFERSGDQLYGTDGLWHPLLDRPPLHLRHLLLMALTLPAEDLVHGALIGVQGAVDHLGQGHRTTGG